MAEDSRPSRVENVREHPIYYVILIKGFLIFEMSIPNIFNLVKVCEEHIFFPPDKFSCLDTSITELLKQLHRPESQ